LYQIALRLDADAPTVLEAAQTLARLERQLQERRKDLAYHADCRPNRKQAEAAIADAKAMNDQWADEVGKRREAEETVARLEREQAEAQHETSLVRAFFAGASPKSQAAMERHIAEVKGLRLQLTACQRERDEALEARDREGKIRDAAVTLQDALLEKNRELRAALADAQRRGPA
jgi:hypothetical protein